MKRFAVIMMIGLLCVVGSEVWAQDSLNVTRLGRRGTTCGAADVFVEQGFALVCSEECGLEVFDVANPTRPERINNFAWGAEGAVVMGDLAYLACSWQGLIIARDYQSDDPQVIGSFVGPCAEYDGYAMGLDVHGDYVYMACADSGLWIVDVSDPQAPVYVSHLDTPERAYDVEYQDGYAYVADWGSLRIIDVTNPATPEEVAFFHREGAAIHDVVVQGGNAFVAAGTKGLRILDILDPTQPEEIGAFNLDGRVWGVAVSGDLAILAVGGPALRVISLSDYAHPVEVGFYETLGTPFSVVAAGNIAYTSEYGDTDHAGFGIYDCSGCVGITPPRPGLVQQYRLHSIFPNPFNSTTSITLDLPNQLRGRLVAYDALGREVRTLIEGTMQAGSHDIHFDGTGLSSGNYFVRFESPQFSSVQKAVLVK